MEDIAEGAGVTRGAAYHHFANKEALYVAMMQSALKEKQALLQTAVASPGTCRDINIFKDPVRNQLVRAYQSALPEQIEIVLQDGIRNGELAPADARLLSWMYVAIVEAVLTPYAERVFDNSSQ